MMSDHIHVEQIDRVLVITIDRQAQKNALTHEMYGAMADALRKLSRDNLSNLTPHPFYVFLNYSHPPVAERVEELGAE